MMWDDEVDVICCGAGFGALAGAIAADDAGLDVFVARDSGPAPAGPAAARMGPGIEDLQTRDYFDALSADLGPLSPDTHDAGMPIRVLGESTPAKRGVPIETFYGARLRDWTAGCLASPYGMLYTRLADRGATPMKTCSGEEIEVNVLGELEPENGVSAASAVNEWLAAQIRERDIHISAGSTLERIVFEEGQVVGAVITTAEGPFALRARHGVAVSTGNQDAVPDAAGHRFAEQGQPLQVCLVGHSASRFVRVELVAIEGKPESRSQYCQSNRVREGLRESSRSHSRRS
ncbi:FAD-binding protein [Mycolicibacterium sp. XJ870]